jgi:hypothetical protein
VKKPSQTARGNAPFDLSVVLKDAPAGAWIALSPDKSRIVGVGDSVNAAAYQAQLNKEENPVLLRMPLEDEGIAAGVR